MGLRLNIKYEFNWAGKRGRFKMTPEEKTGFITLVMKILLVQTSFVGDVILSIPVISGIKKIFPEAVFWMMTTPLSAVLVIRDPLLAGVLIDDKKGKNSGLTGLLKMKRQIKDMAFDRIYSLHRSHRTSLLLWLSRIPLRIGFADTKLSFLYHETRKIMTLSETCRCFPVKLLQCR